MKKSGRGIFGPALAALLLLGIAIGAGMWIGRSASPDSPPGLPEKEAAASRDAVKPAEPTLPPISEAGIEPLPYETAGAAEPGASTNLAVEPVATEPSPPPQPVAQEPPRRVSAGPVKQYSRRNSRVMRQFCEGAGRNTPECRVFLRSVRADAR